MLEFKILHTSSWCPSPLLPVKSFPSSKIRICWSWECCLLLQGVWLAESPQCCSLRFITLFAPRPSMPTMGCFPPKAEWVGVQVRPFPGRHRRTLTVTQHSKMTLLNLPFRLPTSLFYSGSDGHYNLMALSDFFHFLPISFHTGISLCKLFAHLILFWHLLLTGDELIHQLTYPFQFLKLCL